MKATTILRWAIALLLLGTITSNLLAQGVPSSADDAYPAPQATTEPYPWETTEPANVYLTDSYPAPSPTLVTEPYPWETTEPCVVTMHVSQSPGDDGPQSAAARQANHTEIVAQPTVFVPSPEDIAIAQRYGEYVELRLLSDEGWWK